MKKVSYVCAEVVMNKIDLADFANRHSATVTTKFDIGEYGQIAEVTLPLPALAYLIDMEKQMHEEAQLRKFYPALNEVYEKYQTFLSLCK